MENLKAFTPLLFLAVALVVAVPPLALHLVAHPLLYLNHPAAVAAIRRRFFYYAWKTMSPWLEAADRPHIKSILSKAYGTCLEIGSGTGGNIKYYVRDKVERLVLVEPNTAMHPLLRQNANTAGFYESDGSLLILGCGGASVDEHVLNKAGIVPQSLDTIALVHVMCGIPEPASSIEMYRRFMKPGGIMLFYEHVRSSNEHAIAWQQWYTHWLWPYAFDGCELSRPTGAWVLGGPHGADKKPFANGTELVNGVGGPQAMVTKRWKSFAIDEPEEYGASVLPHVLGWAIKA